MKKILINYDYDDPVEVAARSANGVGNYMVPWMLEEALKRRDDVEVVRRDPNLRGGNQVVEVEGVDMVLNSMPMDPIPFLRAKGGMTTLWDLEECSDPKRQYFEYCDVIFHPNYNPYRWDLYDPKKSSYLPLANDFGSYKYYKDEPFKYDVAFLGREELEIYQYRRDVLNALGQRFKVLRGARPRGEQSARLISTGRLTLQVSGWDNMEERFFQFGAIRPMLADYLEELDIVADKDTDYISYTSVEEAVEKADYYLKHMDEAEKIRKHWVKRIKAEHTYDHRAAEVVRILNGGKLDKRGQYLWDKSKDLPKKPGYL